MIRILLPIILLFSIFGFLSSTETGQNSITDGQISDFQARLELAKIFSYNKKTHKEAWKQYIILQKEKPNDPQLWLEISRFLIAQGRNNEALEILKALAHHSTLHFSLEKLSIIDENTPSEKPIHTIVRTEEWISNESAELELARIYSWHKRHWDEAIQLYQILLQKNPHDPTLLLEIGRLYVQKNNFHRALFYLTIGIHLFPCNEPLLIEAARAELGLNHAKKSHVLLQRALSITKNPLPILLDQASIYMMIGDFYKAEAIYKQVLEVQPNSLDIALKLAWALVSAQRYEEAEGFYRKLWLEYPHQAKVIEALAVLKMLEQDFEKALCFLNLLPESYLEGLLLKAEVLYKIENYGESYQIFNQLAYNPQFSEKALIGMGKIYLKWGQIEEAQNSFLKAYQINHKSIPAQFYIAFTEGSLNPETIPCVDNPSDLMEWAELYAENGMGGRMELFEAALNLDPDFFPAYNGLAESLSANYNYDHAIDIYLSILDDFPENSKTMIAIARVLSWGKNYRNSMQWYDDVIALNPADPLPRREKARVANWGKYFNESNQIYESLLVPSVDSLLINSIQEANILCFDSNFSFNGCEIGTVYSAYEAITNFFYSIDDQIDCLTKNQLEEILIYYLPLYRIQKAIFLEKVEKAFDWNNYFIHALPVYQELVQFSPGNFEALYGYAQDYCSLGLCKCSRHIYQKLLHLDPNNDLVKMSLERNLLRTHPLVQGNYTFWTERGAGQFANSQIARHQFDQLYEYSPICNQHIRFIQNEWIEYPFFKQKYYPAIGQTIEVDHVFNEHWRALASVNYKTYFHRFPSQWSSVGSLWYNGDCFNAGMGFERRNEIYNYFCLKQKTQAKVYWATLGRRNHYWNLESTYRHYDYNDSNAIDHINLYLSYLFAEDPKVVKLIFQGNYRNSAHLSELIINPTGQLVDVIHPYWTPRKYFSGSATLQFRYNYAWFTYCEAPQRYIDVRLTGERDNAKNPSVQLIVNWKHELMYHWGFEITGLFHRSRLWDADGIWAQTYYRF